MLELEKEREGGEESRMKEGNRQRKRWRFDLYPDLSTGLLQS